MLSGAFHSRTGKRPPPSNMYSLARVAFVSPQSGDVDGDGGLLEIGEGGALEEGLLVSALFVPEDVGERHLEYGRHGCALRVLAAMRADDNMLDVDIELALRI